MNQSHAQSYVGIVTADGLQAIYRENEHVLRFLDRQIYRKKPFPGLCYWAVIAKPVVEQIEIQIRLGDSLSALQVLQEHADFLGPILPESNQSNGNAAL